MKAEECDQVLPPDGIVRRISGSLDGQVKREGERSGRCSLEARNRGTGTRALRGRVSQGGCDASHARITCARKEEEEMIPSPFSAAFFSFVAGNGRGEDL